MLDVVVFSKNRAAQLELLLRSAKRFCAGWEACLVTVLYDCDGDEHRRAYDLVQIEHPEFDYVLESARAESFRETVLQLVGSRHPLTAFLVDDDVFKAPFSLAAPQLALLGEDPTLACLSLRLDPGMDYSYADDELTGTPALDERLVWTWRGAAGDWGYPMSLDGHVFRTEDLLQLLERADFANPNTLEAALAAAPLGRPRAVCLPTAPVVNVPANRVQDVFANRHAGGSADSLLGPFLRGRRLWLAPFLGLRTRAPHHEVALAWDPTIRPPSEGSSTAPRAEAGAPTPLPAAAAAEARPFRLHLGCGEIYLDGYHNVDFPPSEHSVQTRTRVDEYSDIRSLRYGGETVDEVRLHHVFEHFPRTVACALLVGWRSWLAHGGIVRIEVPDFDRTALSVLSPSSGARLTGVGLRHIFGSNEAAWATHFEGWSPERLGDLCTSLGYEVVDVQRNEWKGTFNFDLVARRTDETLSADECEARVRAFLGRFLVDDSPSETALLEVWLREYRAQVEATWASPATECAA